jgi:dTDP-4-dehydrorhamnose reductase
MDSSKILFTGGNGHLCSEFKKQNNPNFIFLSKEEMDITDCDSLDYVFRNYQFDYVIHTAALTRPMILHDENPSISIDINIIGTANLVKYCIQYNKKIIYISTDFVYESTNGNYSETSGVNPPNKYGISKLGGECSVRLHPNHLIVRLAMIEWPFPHDSAFTNVYKNSIWSDRVPSVILDIKDKNGILNVGEEVQSLYEFVKERIPTIGESTANDSYPKDSSMNLTKLKQ